MPDVFLLHGASSVRYDIATDQVVGDPAPIGTRWSPLPDGFADGVDAALNYGNGKAYFFRGPGYVRVDLATGAVETEMRSIGDFWTGTRDQGFDMDLDAAVNYGDGTVYLFKGSQFASYDVAKDAVSGVGSLADWALAPDGSFDADLSAVVNYGDGNLFFFKGDRYVRFDIASASVATPVRSIGEFWTGTAAAGFAADLDGSWCTADPSGTAAAPAPAPSGELSAYRAEIVRLLEHFKGAVEGDPVFEKEFIAHATLEEQRKASGKEGRTYTTCVDFQMRIFQVAAANLGLTLRTKVLGLLAKDKASAFGGWRTPADGARPQPGDIFMLSNAQVPGQFSHTGYVLSVVANDDGTETWTTVDGGQGTSGKYAKDGVTLVQQGQERLAECRRTYHPDTHLITGEASQGGDARLVDGWVDADTLVAPA